MIDLLLVATIVALAAVVVWGLVALKRLWRPAASPPGLPAATLVERRAVVMLDVGRADSTAPAVQRLVHETATRVLAALPDSEQVEIRARDGSLLGRSSRVVREPRAIWFPEFLHEPHPLRHHGPDLSGHLGEDEPFIPLIRDGPVELPTSAPPGKPPPTIAERLDLVPAIRTSLRNPDDPVDVIRAILESGGLAVDVDDDLLLVDGLAIAVVRHIDGGAHEALNHAYRRIAASRAERGLVIAFGYVDGEEVRRRELLAPEVLHTGFAGLQRMADAVALGADPLRFALAPALAPARLGGLRPPSPVRSDTGSSEDAA